MYIDHASLQQLLEILDKSSVCAGYPEEKFVGMMLRRKSKKIDNKKGEHLPIWMTPLYSSGT